MSDASSRLNLSNPAHPVNRTLTLVKLLVLAVSVAAAIPTARNLYFSWKNDVPFNQVDHRLAQAALLEKNFGCKIDYRGLVTQGTARVEVGSCQKTGDIGLRQWTERPGELRMDRLRSLACRWSPGKPARPDRRALASESAADAGQSFEVAQTCRSFARQNPATTSCGRAVGGVRARNLSIFRGSVEKSETVPCDKACPIK